MDKSIDILLDPHQGYDWITVRATNICLRNGIHTLDNLFSYYKLNKTFDKLSNCGKGVALELEELCKRYSVWTTPEVIAIINENVDLKREVKSLSSDDAEVLNLLLMDKVSDLSVRSRNAFMSYFDRIPDIYFFAEAVFSPSFNFLKWKNVGQKSVDELEGLRSSIIKAIRSRIVLAKEKLPTNDQKVIQIDHYTAVENFDPLKKAAFYRFLEFKISCLSTRSSNSLLEELSKLRSNEPMTSFNAVSHARLLLDFFYILNTQFSRINRIGDKTATELEAFRKEVSAYIEKLHSLKTEDLAKENAALIVNTAIKEFINVYDENFGTFFNEQGQIFLFKLIHFIVFQSSAFPQKDIQIFKAVFTNEKRSLKEISKEINLTTERTRQLKHKLLDTLRIKLSYIANFRISEVVSYGVTEDQKVIGIDETFVSEINESENVDFSSELIVEVYSLVLAKTHQVFVHNEKRKSNSPHSTFYLIENRFLDMVDLRSLCLDLMQKQTSKIYEPYKLHFEGYLLNYIKSSSKDIYSVKDGCELILLETFHLVPHDGFLIFEENVKKLMYKYVEEALITLNKMSTVWEILEVINSKYPDLQISENTIRSTIVREDQIFIYFGRSSTYGLRIWEEKNGDLKGGTIRDLAEQCLSVSEEPLHYLDIVEFVTRYRQTNSKNVIYNLKQDQSGRFRFYEGGFVGLTSKNYDSKSLSFKKISGSHFTTRKMKTFNGWTKEEVAKFYIQHFGYTNSQVLYQLKGKIINGEIKEESNKIYVL